jgi:hypothetical protein
MTEEKLIETAHHMADMHERVIKEMQAIVKVCESYSARLDATEVVMNLSVERLTCRVEFAQLVSGALEKLVDLLRENTVTLNENTERLNEFITKIEICFGSGEGLEHEN